MDSKFISLDEDKPTFLTGDLNDDSFTKLRIKKKQE